MTEYDPNLVPWLRAAQERGGKGTVELDARSIGRVADRINKLEADIERLRAEVKRWKGHHKASMEHTAERVAEIDVKDERIAELESEIERLRRNIDAMNCNRDHVYPLTLADHTKTIAELRERIAELESENKSLRLQREAVAGGASDGLIKAAERIAELEEEHGDMNVQNVADEKRIAVLEEELAKRVPVGLLGVLTEKIDDKLMSVLNERMIGSEIGNA